MTTTACGGGNDLSCFVGFLRAMCASPIYYDVICDTPTFRNALKKDDNCLPGVGYCIGFQTMFGGPKDSEDTCLPWDFYCALEDFYGLDPIPQDLLNYPLLYNMPKTKLTKDDSDELDAMIQLIKGDLWYRGLR